MPTDYYAERFGNYKKVVLNKQISGTMYKIFPMVVWDAVQAVELVPESDSYLMVTAQDKTNTLESDVGYYLGTAPSATLTSAIDALRREIMGLGENETAAQVINSTYDTIREIAAFLTEHEDANDAASYLRRVAVIEGLVGHAAVAQVGEEGDQDYVAPVSATGLFAADAALSARITALENVHATKVEDGPTNGTIKINNSVVTVYDGDPTLIQQDATHRFATDLEKSKWDSLFTFVQSIPAQPDTDTLYLLEFDEYSM